MTGALASLPLPPELEGVPPSSLFVVPRGLVMGNLAELMINNGQALPLCGTDRGYSAVEVIVRYCDRVTRYVSSVTTFDPWRHVLSQGLQSHFAELLDRLGAERAPFAGIKLDRVIIMGIVNVTPDSFSDGGEHSTTEAAIAHGFALSSEGADILDVGGESTRPGAVQVSVEEEQRRVIPVIRALTEKGCVVSIDTRNAATMEAAIANGACIVNDVTALQGDPESLPLIVKKKVSVVLMHMQGDPSTMQDAPKYKDAPIAVYDDLSSRFAECIEAGIQPGLVCIDPGIGFGKDLSHNLRLLNSIALYHGISCPIMIGASRKSFIGHLSNTPDPKDRSPGSIAAALSGTSQGIQILRVHDVADTKQATSVASAIG